MPIPFIGEGGRIVKKVLFLMLCLIMLMALPMAVCAEEDPSPEATTSNKKPKKPKKSPKTADNGMVEAAIILLAVSGGVIYISKRYLQESL